MVKQRGCPRRFNRENLTQAYRQVFLEKIAESLRTSPPATLRLFALEAEPGGNLTTNYFADKGSCQNCADSLFFFFFWEILPFIIVYPKRNIFQIWNLIECFKWSPLQITLNAGFGRKNVLSLLFFFLKIYLFYLSKIICFLSNLFNFFLSFLFFFIFFF